MAQWWEKKNHLETRKGRLFIGGFEAAELAEKFGTPLYVLDADRVVEKYEALRDAYQAHWDKVTVHYAMKANGSLALLSLLRKQGAGVDCVSGGEMYAAGRAGFDGKKMIFTINTKSREELQYAIENGVVITLDAESEVGHVEEIASKLGEKARVCFRVNPDVAADTHAGWQTGKKESKFGVPYEKALAAYEKALAANFVEPVGVHMHIGSQILEAAPFKKAAERLMALCRKISGLGVQLEFVDLGGGIGIRYQKEQKELAPEKVADAVMPLVKKASREFLGDVEVKLEPGRYLVGDAGVLLARVETLKQGSAKKFVAVNAGFNVLVRPAMYGSHHEIVVADNVGGKPLETVDVVGNLCESGDVFAKNRRLPQAREGSVLAFLCAGAYGMSMASSYNMRPLPAEVMIRQGKALLTRERQGYEDLLLYQMLPEGA